MAISMDRWSKASGVLGADIRIWESKRTGQLVYHSESEDNMISILLAEFTRTFRESTISSIRVWDCQTGRAVGSPLWGHPESVNSVCTDEHLIISGTYDETDPHLGSQAQVWNADRLADRHERLR